ncbi:LuxR family transcriptional regulator [Caballeronia calidae]|uniref:LuxR family transcriptional regulator n=1 Tax=Caballeronia calidae TaxID=1777139 RepID=A0A158EHG9_9BURK|nr:autoinducer binding domain-containing protein [Caballeronia calidae]SAL06332.1 LuxR family transcriptional regulator [Caballeronia calidae]
MRLDGLDLLERFQESKDSDQLLSHLSAHAKELGFEYVCCGFQRPSSVRKPLLELLNAYPQGWMDRYIEQNYVAVDPVVKTGKKEQYPILWNDALFASTPTLWSEARDVGLTAGVSQSCWGVNGGFGLLSLARSSPAISAAEFRDVTTHLCWLGTITHHLMSSFNRPTGYSGEPVFLTPREKEILQWSADGKTASEIGDILCIAERTVNFHINNVLPKLGATSKIQATVRAIRLGLI